MASKEKSPSVVLEDFYRTAPVWQLFEATWVPASRDVERPKTRTGNAGYKAPEIDSSCVLGAAPQEVYRS